MMQDRSQTAADLEYRIGRLALKPGEVLVVKIAHTLDAAIGGKIRDRFEAFLGGSNKVLVVDNSIELSVLKPEEIETQPELKAM